MSVAGISLWIGILAAAPEWPLGPYARPGVPLPVYSDERTEVDLDGWRSRIEGLGWVHPMRLTAEGAGPLAVPEGRRLVGVWGDLPPELEAELAAEALVVGVDLARIPPEAWRALDLFDRVYATRRTPRSDALLVAWARAGGSVAVVGEMAGAGGPATLVTAPDAAQLVRAGFGPGDMSIPRLPAVRPWIYDLIGAPVGGVRALRGARWVMSALCVGFGAQLLLASLGRISARALLVGVTLVSAVACGVGLLRARSDFRPLARGRIEIDIPLDASAGVRRRTYEIHVAMIEGAELDREPLWTPVPYRAFSGAWWRPDDGREFLSEGVTRVYAREEWLESGGAVPEGAAPDGLARKELGTGWHLEGAMVHPSPVADPGPVPLLGRFRAARVR